MEYDFVNNKVKDSKSNNITVADLEKKIGIILSNTCIQMIKNNIETTCPTYEELYFLDSSNEDVSGKFVTDNGFFHRENTSMTNSWKWYNFEERPRIFVDPPSQTHRDIIIIEITPNLDTFIMPDFEMIQEKTRVVYHGMYVDKKCKNVIIDSDIWLEHIAKLIHYLRRGCVEGLIPFDNKEYIIIETTAVYIGDSAKWQEQQWFNDSKILCKEICKEY